MRSADSYELSISDIQKEELLAMYRVLQQDFKCNEKISLVYWSPSRNRYYVHTKSGREYTFTTKDTASKLS